VPLPLFPFKVDELLVDVCVSESVSAPQRLIGRVYLPGLLNRKHAGYGVASVGDESVVVGASPPLGMTRLGALAEGVRNGVLSIDVAADRVLSLLRERFEDEGEGGTASCIEAMSASVCMPVLTLAFRRKARSLCSLKVGLSAPGKAAASGREDTTKLDAGMVTVAGVERDGGVRWLAGTRYDRLARQRCVWPAVLGVGDQAILYEAVSKQSFSKQLRFGWWEPVGVKRCLGRLGVCSAQSVHVWLVMQPWKLRDGVLSSQENC